MKSVVDTSPATSRNGPEGSGPTLRTPPLTNATFFESGDASMYVTLVPSRLRSHFGELRSTACSVPEASDYLALFEFNIGVLARTLSADGS